MTQKIDKPFAWYGGKAAVAPLLVSLFPIHKV
jgi:site-specific DNA-adenine methylase